MSELALIERIAARTATPSRAPRWGSETTPRSSTSAARRWSPTTCSSRASTSGAAHHRRCATSARKALAVNLSDLAAMGAEPVAVHRGPGPAARASRQAATPTRSTAGIEEMAARTGSPSPAGTSPLAPVLVLGVTAIGRPLRRGAAAAPLGGRGRGSALRHRASRRVGRRPRAPGGPVAAGPATRPATAWSAPTCARRRGWRPGARSPRAARGPCSTSPTASRSTPAAPRPREWPARPHRSGAVCRSRRGWRAVAEALGRDRAVTGGDRRARTTSCWPRCPPGRLAALRGRARPPAHAGGTCWWRAIPGVGAARWGRTARDRRLGRGGSTMSEMRPAPSLEARDLTPLPRADARCWTA